MRLYQKIIAVLAIGCAAFDSAGANTLNIGPVKLGMTNRQVSEIVRLEDCNPQLTKHVICRTRLSSSVGQQRVTLTFDAQSKKLVKATLELDEWKTLDIRLAQLFRDLSIADCPVSKRGPGIDRNVTNICLEAPNQVRYIRTKTTMLGAYPLHSLSVQIAVDAKLYTEQITRLIAAERNKLLYRARQQKNHDFEGGN